ncbi:hypothetical protein MMC13_003590 [Lambiella insularis]|nr:hypothetical protein [Lambiella insularis]
MPPNRVYVHPDEQIEMLKEKITEQDVEGEREWVLPTHLREKWSLRRFAEVFDAVGTEPPGEGKQEVEGRGQDEEPGEVEGIGVETETGSQKGMKRRGGKRVLLATVSDDSTIVYYIVHDGLVKPRQN